MRPISKRLYLRHVLSVPRYRHSIGTAEMTVRLCSLHGYPKHRGKTAALLHDIARELSDQEIVRLSRLDGLPIADWELGLPILLHGRAGSVLIRNLFRITDPDILEAVSWHTTGRPGMGILAKILFVADYIAPDREHVDDTYRESLFRESLDQQVLRVLDDLIAYMERKGMFIAPPSVALKKELEEVSLDG